MPDNFVAEATTTIDATAARVWSLITDPATLGPLMMDATITTDWKVGSPITWTGEFKGKPFEDKGEIVEVNPDRRLTYTHYSPMSGKPDAPENYHTLTWTIDGDRPSTLRLSQAGNGSAEEAAHAKEMWDNVVNGVKAAAEER